MLSLDFALIYYENKIIITISVLCRILLPVSKIQTVPPCPIFFRYAESDARIAANYFVAQEAFVYIYSFYT